MPSHSDSLRASSSSASTALSFTSPLKARGTHRQGILDVKAVSQRKESSTSRSSRMAVNSAPTDPQKQEDLKKQIIEELRALAFEDSSLLARFRPVSEQELKAIRQALRTAYRTKHPSHPLKGRLPSKTQEEVYYKPIADLFNVIGGVYHASTSSRSPYVPLQVYDRTTKDGVDGSASLKPDFIGLADNNNATRVAARYRWHEIGLAGDVKDTWPDLVAQAGTYGRAILNAHPTRTFALVFAFNQSDKKARFLFFHRGGLHSTPAFDITTDKGLDNFIHGVIVATALQHGHLSWTLTRPTTNGAKPDTLRPFPFEVDECVYQRIPMTGRCTAGWILRRVHQPGGSSFQGFSAPAAPVSRDQDLTRRLTRSRSHLLLQPGPFNISGPSIQAPASRGKRQQREQPEGSSSKRRKTGSGATSYFARESDAEQKALESFIQDDAFRIWYDIHPLSWKDDSDLPARLFVKDAWAPADHADEPRIHELMSGEFGAPDLWAHQVLDSNEFFYEELDHCKDWSIFLDLEERKIPPPPFYHNVMVHLAMYFSTIGVPLRQAMTPRELMVPVLHAMLAHYALYKKHDMVHRDISCNNIMRLNSVVLRSPPLSPQHDDLKRRLSAFVESEGILIDADLARNVNAEEIYGKKVSGTWPYISRRIHENASSLLPDKIQHNATDDLESSIWVILWELYNHARRKGSECLSKAQHIALIGLRHHDSERMLKAKNSLYRAITEAIPQCPPLNVFVGQVLRLTEQFGEEEALSGEVIEDAYQQYFSAFLDCLDSNHESLTQTWDEVFHPQQLATPDLPRVLTMEKLREKRAARGT